jgi:hypothetical protein
MILSVLEAKNVPSSRKKKPKVPRVAMGDHWNCRRNTTEARTQVQRNVPVTAMP